MTTVFASGPAPLRERVAAEVRALMGRYGLSQTRLAEMLQWKQQYLSRRLTASVPFDTNDLEALAGVFEVQPETFFRGPKSGKRIGAKFSYSWRRFNNNSVITRLLFADSA